MSDAEQRVRDLLDFIEQHQFSTPETHARDLINVDDDELASELGKLARSREIDENDAITVQSRLDAARDIEMTAAIERHSECFAQSEVLTLFKVKNRAGRSVDILAKSADCARHIASVRAHVQTEENAEIYRYNDAYMADLRSNSPALWRALQSGAPGLVERIGNHVIVKGIEKVIHAPISGIE